ncbi:MAG: hypothetical protein IPN78_15060 [Candidatus Accumulibacter sp.]|nr:hypothetical protein [Candidatus Accumulibacter propinquus]
MLSKEGALVHHEALVPRRDYENGVELPVSRDVYGQYMRTQAVLANNGEGHLTGHPLTDKLHTDTAKHIRLAQNFTINQLVYVEAELAAGQLCPHTIYRPSLPISLAYTSSIRRKGGELRAASSPLAGEFWKRRSLERPKLLSGSRLLFGYVHDEHNPIGAGVYQRLAGRIAINHALSESKPKFLGEAGKGWCIPLPILGQPKPSAWEFYLQQKPGSRLPATYGDLLG